MKHNNTDKIEGLIQNAVKRVAVEGGKCSVGIGIGSRDNLSEFDRSCYLIAYHVPIKGFNQHDNAKIRFVKGAIYEMAKSGTNTYRSFEDIIKIKSSAYLKQRVAEYLSVFVTNVSSHFAHYPRVFPSIRCGNILVRFAKYSSLPDFIRTVVDDDEKKGYVQNIKRCWLAFVSTKARDPWSAFTRAHDAYSIFRSSLNFSTLWGCQIAQYGVRMRPMTMFLPSLAYHVFDSSHICIDSWYHPTPIDWKIEKLPRDLLDKSRRFIKFVDADQNTTRKIILQAIVMYTEALDQIEYWTKYIGLWQVLEYLGCMGENEKLTDDKLLQRLKGFLSYDEEKELLNPIYAKRNKIVHEGRSGIVDTHDVAWIKSIVDHCLFFYIRNVNALSTPHHVRVYLQYATLGAKQQSATVNVLKGLIKKQKK